MPRRFALCVLLGLASGPLLAQQEADTSYVPPIDTPAWPSGRGPVVAIDQGHSNFHTAGGRYRPFAAVLRRDGYTVRPAPGPIGPKTLAGIRVLVVANALGTVPEGEDTSASAFTSAEVGHVRRWVEGGGSLLLIADHMPFPGAARSLAAAFGFELTDGFAVPASGEPDAVVFSRAAGTLRGHAITEGVDSVVSFTGAAFTGNGATPILVFGRGTLNLLPRKPWEFDGSTVRRPADGWWQGAVKEVGKGRVAVFGEAAMFTAQLAGPGHYPVGMNHAAASQNVHLLRNLLRWLARAGDGAPGSRSEPGGRT